MATGQHSAPQPTLGDLEQRLVALERELCELLDSPPALAQAPAADASGPPPRRLEPADYEDEIAALVRFRDLIAAAAAELVADYDRILERLRTRAAPKGQPVPADDRGRSPAWQADPTSTTDTATSTARCR